MTDKTKPEAMTAERVEEIRRRAAAMLTEANSWCHSNECSRDDQCEDSSDEAGCSLHDKHGCPPCICGIGELLQLRKSVESGISDLLAALELARVREEQASKRAQKMVERAQEWRNVWIQTAEWLGIQTGPETSGPDLTAAIVKRVRAAEQERDSAIAASAESARKYAESVVRIAELKRRIEHSDYFYATRFERLSDWARSLAPELSRMFFNIVANGTAVPHEPPTYAQQMNMLRHERDALAARVAELERDLRAAEGMAEGAFARVAELERETTRLSDENKNLADYAEAYHEQEARVAELEADVKAMDALVESRTAHGAEGWRRLTVSEKRVAELEGALHRDKTGLGAALAEIAKIVKGYGWIGRGEWGLYADEERTAATLRAEATAALKEIGDLATEALAASGKLAQATMCPAAPPEQAPARCVGCGHAPHETGTCGLGCECIVDGQEQAPAPPRTDDGARPADPRQEIAAARSARMLGHGEAILAFEDVVKRWNNERLGLFVSDVRREFAALGPADASDDERAKARPADVGAAPPASTGTASAAVTVCCSSRVAERAAPSGIEVDPAITPEQIRRDSDRDTAAMFAEEMAPPAADPLCARDLGGGRKCGHRPSEHRPARSPWGCRLCPCSGFIPPAPPKEKRCPCGLLVSCSAPESHRIGCPDLAKALAEKAAADGEPANFCRECDGRGRLSEDKQCEACRGTGGPDETQSEPARTCVTCAHYAERLMIASGEPDGLCNVHGGVPVFTNAGETCGLWSPKSGGSSTEGGESHG